MEQLEQFNGNFTESLRLDFRRRRLGLKLSLAQLSQLLDVHWTTIGKWETGIIRRCHPAHRHKVAAFLSGRYDCSIRQRLTPFTNLPAASAAPELLEPLTSLGSVFQLLSTRADLQNLLTYRLNAIVENLMLQRLTARQYASCPDTDRRQIHNDGTGVTAPAPSDSSSVEYHFRG
jgi:hypothetical protein